MAPCLDVLFCGINPGLWSAATGYNFARPGNRFWPALHGAGFTPRLLAPEGAGELRRCGRGTTNIVAGASGATHALPPAELRAGARNVEELVRRWQPRVLAMVG